MDDTIFDEEVAPKYILRVKADTASLPVRGGRGSDRIRVKVTNKKRGSVSDGYLTGI